MTRINKTRFDNYNECLNAILDLMEDEYLFEVITNDWKTIYSTTDQNEIDRYINTHPDIYMVHYRRVFDNGELGPVYVYFSNTK